MQDTGYSRNLDSIGRLVIPSKIRTALNLENGSECRFYTTVFEGETYLCIKCPTSQSELRKAIQIVQSYGLKVVKSAN